MSDLKNKTKKTITPFIVQIQFWPLLPSAGANTYYTKDKNELLL